MPTPTPTMMSSKSVGLLDRRSLLTAAAAVMATDAIAQAGRPLLTRRGTPQLTLGPFYPVERPPEEDWDLTTIAGRPGRAQGQAFDLVGQVLTEDGRPVPHASIDMWQANALGSYQHGADPSGAPRDPAFQGAAILRADDAGRYRLRTIRPAAYADRLPHIHFDVKGTRRRLMTQMFFPEEPNARDRLYAGLADADLQRAVTATPDAQEFEPGVSTYRWDITLAGE